MPWTFYLIYALYVIESICLCLKLNSLLIFCSKTLKSYSELASENLIRCQEAVFLWKHFAKSQTAGNSNFAKSFLNKWNYICYRILKMIWWSTGQTCTRTQNWPVSGMLFKDEKLLRSGTVIRELSHE